MPKVKTYKPCATRKQKTGTFSSQDNRTNKVKDIVAFCVCVCVDAKALTIDLNVGLLSEAVFEDYYLISVLCTYVVLPLPARTR